MCVYVRAELDAVAHEVTGCCIFLFSSFVPVCVCVSCLRVISSCCLKKEPLSLSVCVCV